MSSAGKNEGISGMGHSSSLTSMSSAGLGGRVVTERGLGIMVVLGALSRWSSLSVSAGSALSLLCVPRSRREVVGRTVVEAECAASACGSYRARIALI